VIFDIIKCLGSYKWDLDIYINANRRLS